MKNLSLMTVGLLAAGLVSTASATETFYVTGSTAYRANVNNALHSDGTALGLDNATSVIVGGTFSSSASSLVFSNSISGTPVLIKTAFTGSEAGIASLLDVAIIDPTPVNANAPLPNTPLPTFLGDDGTSGGPNAGTHLPDIAMADTSQAVSLTRTPTLNTVGGGPVGIVQFTYMKSTNIGQANWSHLTNVSIPQLNVLLSSGELDLSFFTGISDDFGTTIKLCGRNFGSGTRANQLIEALYGTGKAVTQFAGNPTYAANGSLNKPSTVNNLTAAQVVNIGNDGYDSGGGVVALLSDTGTFTNIFVGPIGLPDAITVPGVTLGGSAVTGSAATGIENGFFAAPGGQFISLNGVYYSDQAICNGAYDYYGHEHMFTSSSSQANAVTLAGKLFTDLQNSLTGGTTGLPIADLEADRPSDGDTGFVIPNYTVN